MSSDSPTTVGSEREILTELLADNRAEILALLDGVTEEEARRSLVPSLTTLLGLVKHAAFAEQVWFHVVLENRKREELGLSYDIDDSFRLTESDTVESIVAHFVSVTRESDRIASRHRLSDTGKHHRLGEVSLRWMYVHMIEELARHAGHGDIIREQIEGAR